MTKLVNAIFVVALLSSVAIIGCGDSGGSGGSGTSAGEACSGPDCVNDPEEKAVCEAGFNECVDRGVNVEECVIGAELICG